MAAARQWAEPNRITRSRTEMGPMTSRAPTQLCTGTENSLSEFDSQEQLFVCTRCRCESDKSLHRLLSEALLWRKEKARLKELLRTTTNALEDKAFALTSYQASLADLLIAQTEKDGSDSLRPIHMLALDLKDRLSFSEMQMELLREERDRSVLNSSELEKKVATCTSIAEEQSEFIRCQLTTIHKMEERASHHQSMLQQVEMDKKKELKQLEEQILFHQQRAAVQEGRLNQQLQKTEAAKVQCRALEKRAAALEELLQNQMASYQELEKELIATKEELGQNVDKSAELREAHERMEQTWADNARLLKLLSATGMFHELFDKMQNSSGAVYLPLTGKASKFQSLVERYHNTNGRTANPKLEADNWVPVEAFDIVSDFRQQYCPSVPVTAVNDLLAQLAYFWRELEKRKVAQVKTRTEKALVDLKRQHSMSRQYDEVVGPSFVKPVRLRRGQNKVVGSSVTQPVSAKHRYTKDTDIEAQQLVNTLRVSSVAAAKGVLEDSREHIVQTKNCST